MCHWIATEIVLTPGLKQRTAVLGRIIEICDRLLVLKNFCSIMAIYLALSMSCIERLFKTWKGLPSRHQSIWQKVSQLMDPAKNFKQYRKAWSECDYEARIPVPSKLN